MIRRCRRISFIPGCLVVASFALALDKEFTFFSNIESEGFSSEDLLERRRQTRILQQNIISNTGSTIWDEIGEGILPKQVPHESSLETFDTTRYRVMVDFSPTRLGSGNRRPTRRPGRNPRPRPRPRPNSSSSKGKGKGKGKGSSSSSKSSKRSSKGRPVPSPTRAPVSPPIPPNPPNPSPSPQPGCKTTLNLNFLQLSAIPPAIFVDQSDPNEQTLGTRYIYRDGLRDRNSLDELQESKVSGFCTRTQSRVGNPDIGLQLGSGYCDFSYVLRDSTNRELMFTASGDMTDSLGGILAVTGGSRSSFGAYGEIELLPVNLVGEGDFEVEPGDVFLDPLFYLVDVRLVIPCED